MLTLLTRLEMLPLTLSMKNTLYYLYLECLGHQELENKMGMGVDGGRTDHTPKTVTTTRGPAVQKIFANYHFLWTRHNVTHKRSLNPLFQLSLNDNFATKYSDI